MRKINLTSEKRDEHSRAKWKLAALTGALTSSLIIILET